MARLVRRIEVPVPAEELFAWHERPGAFQRLTPPWQPVELSHSEGIHDGDRAVIELGPRALPLRWVAEHRDYEAGRQFRDVQLKGPFAQWEHTHRMRPHPVRRGHAVLEDRVDYELPLSSLSEPLAGRFAQRELVRLFGYRHRVTLEDLSRHTAAGLPPLTVAVTGSTGLIGEALVAFLTTGGHTVVRLVRSRGDVLRQTRSEQERAAFWDPARGVIDPAALEGVDAVVHLAGEPVLGFPWDRRKRGRIFLSRVRGTRLLADTMAAMAHPPAVFLSASGSGYYGDRGHEPLTEAAPPGEGFLADVCRAWEAASEPAEEAGIRVCRMRLGVVLSPRGGMLGVAHPAFAFGLGGTVGRGERWVPWIALDDVLYAVLHLLGHDELSGPVNLAAPHPVTQRTFSDALGDVLNRPAPWRVPPSLLRLTLGELAEETVLQSTRVVPHRLVNSGYAFAYPRNEEALRHLLGRSPAVPLPSEPV